MSVEKNPPIPLEPMGPNELSNWDTCVAETATFSELTSMVNAYSEYADKNSLTVFKICEDISCHSNASDAFKQLKENIDNKDISIEIKKLAINKLVIQTSSSDTPEQTQLHLHEASDFLSLSKSDTYDTIQAAKKSITLELAQQFLIQHPEIGPITPAKVNQLVCAVSCELALQENVVQQTPEPPLGTLAKMKNLVFTVSKTTPEHSVSDHHLKEFKELVLFSITPEIITSSVLAMNMEKLVQLLKLPSKKDIVLNVTELKIALAELSKKDLLSEESSLFQCYAKSLPERIETITLIDAQLYFHRAMEKEWSTYSALKPHCNLFSSSSSSLHSENGGCVFILDEEGRRPIKSEDLRQYDFKTDQTHQALLLCNQAIANCTSFLELETFSIEQLTLTLISPLTPFQSTCIMLIERRKLALTKLMLPETASDSKEKCSERLLLNLSKKTDSQKLSIIKAVISSSAEIGEVTSVFHLLSKNEFTMMDAGILNQAKQFCIFKISEHYRRLLEAGPIELSKIYNFGNIHEGNTSNSISDLNKQLEPIFENVISNCDDIPMLCKFYSTHKFITPSLPTTEWNKLCARLIESKFKQVQFKTVAQDWLKGRDGKLWKLNDDAYEKDSKREFMKMAGLK